MFFEVSKKGKRMPNGLKNKFTIEEFGFFRAASISPFCTVADIDANKKNVLAEIQKAETNGVNIILFPQLVITSASCGNLFKQTVLTDAAFKAVTYIAEKTAGLRITAITGFPLLYKDKLYSAEAVIHNGGINAIVPVAPSKLLHPFFSYYNFSQTQYVGTSGIPFASHFIFYLNTEFSSCSFIIKSFYENTAENIPDADFILTPLAEPSYAFSFSAFKTKYKNLSAQKNAAVIAANCGTGESTTDYVFAGETGIFEAGKELHSASALTAQNAPSEPLSVSDIDAEFIKTLRRQNIFSSSNKFIFSETYDVIEINVKTADGKNEKTAKTLLRKISTYPFLPDTDSLHEAFLYKNYYSEIINLQMLALAKRLTHIGCTKCVLGISGGTDSTLALLSALKCFDFLNIPHKNLYAVTMPCFGTTEKTKTNAVALASLLGCTVLQIPITESVKHHFFDIGQAVETCDVTFENAQARERTQVLMDKANQIGGIMLGTGDLSESALGWMTYNGDHISMYEFNSSIPKTLLKGCIKSFVENKVFFKDGENAERLKNILSDIIATPISPELLPPQNGQISQKTETVIGSYELHDFFLYHIVRNGFSPKKVFFLATEAFDCEKYPPAEILKTLHIFYKRFFSHQFKRSCSADGADVTGFSLSPRSAWTMPSDASYKIWLNELEILNTII